MKTISLSFIREILGNIFDLYQGLPVATDFDQLEADFRLLQYDI